MLYKRLFLSLSLLSLGQTKCINAEPAEKTPTLIKVAIGGTIGGTLMYLFNKLASSAHSVEFENKDKFLSELQEYVNSTEYKEQKEAGRAFNHYYNGLNQLATDTSGIGVSLLKDFSFAQDEKSREELLTKIKQLSQRLRSNYESGLFYSKVFSIGFGILFGALIACSDGEGSGRYGNNYTGVYYTPSYRSSNFFR